MSILVQSPPVQSVSLLSFGTLEVQVPVRSNNGLLTTVAYKMGPDSDSIML